MYGRQLMLLCCSAVRSVVVSEWITPSFRAPRLGGYVADQVGSSQQPRDNAGDNFAILEPSGNVLVFGESGAVY
jgi:hypothetical protein